MLFVFSIQIDANANAVLPVKMNGVISLPDLGIKVHQQLAHRGMVNWGVALDHVCCRFLKLITLCDLHIAELFRLYATPSFTTAIMDTSYASRFTSSAANALDGILIFKVLTSVTVEVIFFWDVTWWKQHVPPKRL
jgi:hypothetical protein